MFARGVLSFYPAPLLALPEIRLTPLFPLDTKIGLASLFFPLLTQKQGGGYPRKNVGAPTFLIFPLIFCSFSLSHRRVPRIRRRRWGKRAGPPKAGWPRSSIRGAKGAHESQRYIGESGKRRQKRPPRTAAEPQERRGHDLSCPYRRV